jgi:hypothetical protein
VALGASLRSESGAEQAVLARAVEEKDGRRRVDDGHHTAALHPCQERWREGWRGRVEAVGTHQLGNGGEGGRRCTARGGGVAVVAVTMGEIESGERK